MSYWGSCKYRRFEERVVSTSKHCRAHTRKTACSPMLNTSGKAVQPHAMRMWLGKSSHLLTGMCLVWGAFIGQVNIYTMSENMNNYLQTKEKHPLLEGEELPFGFCGCSHMEGVPGRHLFLPVLHVFLPLTHAKLECSEVGAEGPPGMWRVGLIPGRLS